MREKIVSIGVLVVFIMLAAWIVNLALLKGKQFRELSRKNTLRIVSQPGARGKIIDRTGQVIAGNRLSYDVMVVPDQMGDRDRLTAKLAAVLNLPQRSIAEKIRNSSWESFSPVTVARNVDIKKAIALEELKLDFGGIVIQPNPVREYPYGKLACHALGYLGEIDHWRLTKLADYGYQTRDIVGFGGIEERYDYYLRQDKGGLLVEVDHRGKFVRVLGFKPPVNGRDIKLTIDIGIQKIAESALADKKGSVIILDPYNGEIYALVSSPGFNPSAFFGNPDPAAVRRVVSSPDAALLDRSISGTYPAASIFKVVVAAAGLDTGKIIPNTVFNCPGYAMIGNKQFKCWDTHNDENLLQAITHSCDVYFYRTGLIVGQQAIHDYAVRLGLSRPTGIELPYESAGLVPSAIWKRLTRFQGWFDGDTANFSIGQGDLLVTPLQIARLMAVFANSGSLVYPHIILSISGNNTGVLKNRTTRVDIRPETIECIRQGLRLVVSDPSGTANNLADLPVAVAGKTGTAQVSRGHPHGWFAGFFPYKHPKYVICVFLEHGGAGFFASSVARDIIGEMEKEGYLQ